MNFQQATERLKAMAPGKFQSVEYKLTTHHTGDKVQECSLYVDDYGYAQADSWEKSFEIMDHRLSGSPIGADISVETIEELPNEQTADSSATPDVG
jgi:hypothetical protein